MTFYMVRNPIKFCPGKRVKKMTIGARKGQREKHRERDRMTEASRVLETASREGTTAVVVGRQSDRDRSPRARVVA